MEVVVTRSPIENLISTPDFVNKIADIIYLPSRTISTFLDRPEDQIMYLVSFLLAVLTGWTINCIYNVKLRKGISVFMGCFIQIYMYGKGFYPSMSFVIVSYFTMRYASRKAQHKIIFIVNALLLSLAHLHKMYYYYGFWGAEITNLMMMNLCRITAVSICYKDGAVPEKDREEKLKTRERVYAIDQCPSFYDYLGYLYYCGGTIAGPFYEYKDYINFMHREGHYLNIPSTIIPTIKRLAVAIFFIGAVGVMSDYFPFSYVLTDEFAAQAYWKKMLIMLGTLKLKLFTYYTAFCLMDSGSIASGLSYNGLDLNKTPKFDRVQNIRIYDIEFSYKVQEFFNAWNISVHMWLKHYVFLRLVKKGQKIGIVPILTTFIVSAVWHGFYPGYFMFFISSGFNDYMFKAGSKIYILFEWVPKFIQKFLLFSWSYFQCAYWGLSFILLDLKSIHKLHSAVHYSLHFVLAFALLFINFSGIIPYCKRLESKKYPDRVSSRHQNNISKNKQHTSSTDATLNNKSKNE
eukprot:403360089